MDITEKKYAHDFLRSEQPNFMSRKLVTIASGAGLLAAGTVLGAILLAGATAAAFAGNTGTGAMGAITVAAGAKVGAYKLVVIEPGTNAGKFTVEDPDGITVGVGTVGAAFSGGGLSFTLADGGTDFASGDGFIITVAAGSGKYVQPTATATDGSGVGTAILLAEVDATDADVADAPVIYRDAQVAEEELIYDASINDDSKKAVVDAGLLAANIQFLASV